MSLLDPSGQQTSHQIPSLSLSGPSPVRVCVCCSVCLSSFLTPMSVFTEMFQVIAPSEPIVAELGGDTTLSCSLDPVMSAENMELRWFRSHFSESVFIYQDRQEQNEEVMAQYAGRTSLVGEFLRDGVVAVTIHRVQASDHGLYTCSFSNGVVYEQATLELQVAGMDSSPQVHISGPEEDGVRVVCTTSGWFPEPQVQWRDPSGQQFLEFSKVQAQDTEGLFSVEATLVVRDSSVGSVTCSIINPILGQQKAMAIVLPEPFFPRASPWKPAFLVSLSLLLLLLLGAACYTWREHSTWMRELQEQRNLCKAEKEDQQTKQEALKDRNQRKAAYLVVGCAEVSPVCSLSAWRKAQLYADWRKEQFRAWPVTLDPISSTSSGIALSHDRKSLICDDFVIQESILGLEGIRQVPRRVGVFLDYAQGDVSFYDMTDGSHIFSFPPESFSGTLLPYFVCFSKEVSMTLCPLEAGPQKPSVPRNNPSLEEPGGPSGDGIASDSGVDGAPPGPEAPLLS
ncbi:Butyrophilin-like protein 1 [Galemys pyrenaicus]|uniref:Butyrophilin-like protein 1 n=1 Tax=Galemys pyrenaicus TaxID=202257 RepID=A0A8J6DWV6_GALPY|nr:Butyrophilin-like protein 1 [Galemys pyrenaicus]